MNGYQKKIKAFFCLFICCFFSSIFTRTIRKHRLRRKKISRRIYRKKRINIPLHAKNYAGFSRTIAHYLDWQRENHHTNTYIWQSEAPINFDELILSWNARRPTRGSLTFWISVKHNGGWSPWHRIAEWGPDYQQTFVNKLNRYVHTKHVKVEMQRGLLGKEFRIKVFFRNGALPKDLHALFACVSDMKQFKEVMPDVTQPSLKIESIPKQSQMTLDHEDYRELCSPTSLAMITKYFQHMYYDPIYPHDLRMYATDFANKVRDNRLNIYGSWPLNVAQAYEASEGEVFFCIERLNSFENLYQYLAQRIPIAVSVRRLKGGATPYAGGHFLVVVGWDQIRQAVLCLDPAFKPSRRILKAYKLKNFLRAWALSRNFAYVPIPKKLF